MNADAGSNPAASIRTALLQKERNCAMSRSVNRVFLLGNIGSEPEIRTTSNGTLVAKLSLATNRQWTDKSTGEQKEKVQWHRVTFFGRLAEIVESYVHQGDRMFIEGRIEYSESETDGQKRYWTDVIGQEMVMLGGAGADASGSSSASKDDDFDLPY